jgi:hypothetical protein
VARRLCTVAGFYRYAEEEGLLAVSPAVHVRPPRLDYESLAIGLDRDEVGALLVAAGLGPAIERALISVLALNGLRVSEATGANIESLGLERGHRTLTILRKGGKIVTIPLAPEQLGPSTWPSGNAARGRSSRRRRQPSRPRRGGPHRAPGRSAGRDHQAHRTPYAAPRLHHRRPSERCRSETYKKPPAPLIPGLSCATTGPGSRSTGTTPTWSHLHRRRQSGNLLRGIWAPPTPDGAPPPPTRDRAESGALRGRGIGSVLRAPSSVGLAKRDHEIGDGGAPHDEEENP